MQTISISDKTVKTKPSSRQTLGAARQRITRQRALLLDLIRRTDGHLDADELHRRARVELPRISLSTVYRTLQLFRRLGLVEQHRFDEDHLHYEASPAGGHHHLVCLGCGRIVEFECHLSEQLQAEVAQRTKFKITEAEVNLEGYCPECQQRKRI